MLEGTVYRRCGQVGLPLASHRGPRKECFIARSQTRNRPDALGNKKRQDKTYERILRYPNGDTRRIRYPIDETVEEHEDCSLDDLFWVASDAQEVPPEDQPVSSLNTATESETQAELPTSPAELIRYLNSKEYRDAQKELQRKVQGSYQVLEGCPWVQARPLFLIAVKNQEGKDDPLTYTLPTRVERDDTAKELAKMLRKGREGVFSVGEVLDGVISFQDRDDGERFRANLEAEGHVEATLCEVDSHELFRNTREAKAVVVLMNCEDYIPYPLELGTSLRGHTSFEDWED